MVIAGSLTLSPSQRDASASPELDDLHRAVDRALSVITVAADRGDLAILITFQPRL